ncbi:MAG: hypothetical protein U0992_17570 [Planctomycetaceae bacterium]
MQSQEPNRDLFARLPRWLQVCLYPVFVVFIGIPTMVVLGLLLFVLWPRLILQGWLEDRAWWKKMRRLGRVVEWPVVERELTCDSSTLVVEVGPKGPYISWLINAPRDVIDPAHVIPNWHQLVCSGYSVFDEVGGERDLIADWTVERLSTFADSAQAMHGDWQRVDRLPISIQRQSVLAIHELCEGCLSWRFSETDMV